jgi:hypothetical protein
MDSGKTASGGTTATPGIAVYNRATLGGYWRAKFPNGRTIVLRQTDLGPSASGPKGKRIADFTYSALALAGYTEQNYPTDATVSITYLGKKLPTGTALTKSGPATDLFTPAGAQPSGAMYALLFVAMIAGGAILAGLGVNRAAGGAPARALRKVPVPV